MKINSVSEYIDQLKLRKVFLFNDKVENLYDFWESPNLIVSDGAYGVSGFKGDTHSADDLPEWYEPHIREWSKKAGAGTTLWFWNTEIGFAKVHPVFEKYDWEYVSCNIWNKGLQHIAGNCNLKILKTFPIVTEVCVQYVRKPIFRINNQKADLKEWLRHEWCRAGLSLYQANEACDIANAGSRKYLTKDHLWYPPPVEHFEKLVIFANHFGDPERKPYFSLDGRNPLSKQEYAKLFSIFKGRYGITNVWEEPPLHSRERIKVNGSGKYFHLNQKPLSLMQLIVSVSSDKDQIVWEPFGGLFSASLAAHQLDRKVYAAEVDEFIFETGLKRFISLYHHPQKSIFENSEKPVYKEYALA